MLSVPTLWTSFFAIFAALAIVWAYVQRRYPSMVAARYWAASSALGMFATGLSIFRFPGPVYVSLVLTSAALLASGWVSYHGVRRFYELPINWTVSIVSVLLAAAGLLFFAVVVDQMVARIVIYSVFQAVPMALAFKVLLERREDENNGGARLAGYAAMVAIVIYVARSLSAMFGIGGAISIFDFNALQAVFILILAFVVMVINFGFLLMSIDRLRDEVSELALVDDLTGVANRRRLQQRLTYACEQAPRSGQPFSLLAIDLDGFKQINDSFGHAAGDACLQHFTLMVQSRLRSGDMLARVGGDEFNVFLPATTLSEAVVVARKILEACRADATSGDISLATSIGVAQWSSRIGRQPELLLSAADVALYKAKHLGRNCYACDDESVTEEEVELSAG